MQPCCSLVSRVLEPMGQRIGSWGSGLTCETTRSAHKVGFITDKGKAVTRDEQGVRNLVATCCLQFGGGYLVLFVGEGNQKSGMECFFLTYLYKNIYTDLWKPPGCWPCGILRHLQGAMTYETTCPFKAHSALTGVGGTGSFGFLIPQTQQQEVWAMAHIPSLFKQKNI
jgi:hypothetical protein